MFLFVRMMSSNTTRTNSCKIMQLCVPSPHPLEQEIRDCVSKIEVLRFISVAVSNEEEPNTTFCLALSGKDGRSHNFFLLAKECDSADGNSNNAATVITTDEVGHSYVVSTDDDFLLDNLWIENCREHLKEKSGNLNGVLKHLTDVFNNIMLETGRLDDSAAENYVYDDDSELSNSESVCDGTGTNHNAIGCRVAAHVEEEEDNVALLFQNLKRACPGGSGHRMASSSVATNNTRLMKELSSLMKTDTTVLGFSIDLVDDCDISLWNIHLFNFEDCGLAIDMNKLEAKQGIKTIEVELDFPNDYPYSPPQARIIRPRFRPGTGFIVKGGFCIDLLTKEVGGVLHACAHCPNQTVFVLCILYILRK